MRAQGWCWNLSALWNSLLVFPSGQVLLSLRILLMMKPSLLNRVSHQIAYGLHELLKTNAANIHSGDDWYTLFTLLECIGSGVKPPPALQVTARAENDTGKAGGVCC